MDDAINTCIDACTICSQRIPELHRTCLRCICMCKMLLNIVYVHMDGLRELCYEYCITACQECQQQCETHHAINAFHQGLCRVCADSCKRCIEAIKREKSM